jgi:hypothetical protein
MPPAGVLVTGLSTRSYSVLRGPARAPRHMTTRALQNPAEPPQFPHPGLTVLQPRPRRPTPRLHHAEDPIEGNYWAAQSRERAGERAGERKPGSGSRGAEAGERKPGSGSRGAEAGERSPGTEARGRKGIRRPGLTPGVVAEPGRQFGGAGALSTRRRPGLPLHAPHVLTTRIGSAPGRGRSRFLGYPAGNSTRTPPARSLYPT